MECPNCHQLVETGAAFCGNCGQALTATPVNPGAVSSSVTTPTAMPTAANATVLPAYALATPQQHAGENKALLSLLMGIVGIVGALFVPLLGLAMGVAGVAFGTISRGLVKRRLALVGIAFSSLAILVGLATWAYAVHQLQARKLAATKSASSSSSSVVSANLSTPCYSASLVDRLNVVNAHGSCDASAFNGQTLDTSSNAYKVYASQSAIANVDSFTALAKSAVEKDIQTNLPTFSIDSERVSGFAGSPSYTVNASDKSNGVAIVEAAVYHPVASGDNVFILVHAINGNTADLQILEAQWQWK